MSTALWELASGQLPDPERLAEPADAARVALPPQDPRFALLAGIPVDPLELAEPARPGPTRAGLQERADGFLNADQRAILGRALTWAAEQLDPRRESIQLPKDDIPKWASELEKFSERTLGAVQGWLEPVQAVVREHLEYMLGHPGDPSVGKQALNELSTVADILGIGGHPGEFVEGPARAMGVLGRAGRGGGEELAEQVLRATVRTSEDTPRVFSGVNHAAALDKAKRAGVPDEFLPSMDDMMDPGWGFRTDLRDHVDRGEAARLVREGGATQGIAPMTPDQPGLRYENLEPGQTMRPTSPTARVAYTSPDLPPKLEALRARWQQLTRRYAADPSNSAPEDFGQVPLLGRGEYDEETARQIATIYERAPSVPDDPEVQAAYEAFAREVDEQFDFITGTLGIEMIPTDVDPYRNSTEMMRDLLENKRLKVYASETDHPLLSHDQQVRFRFIHDVMGHGLFGNSFGKVGEENAARMHSELFGPAARRAMLTETRGQNSWVNWGPKGEHNRANPAETIFAPQKVFLMPERYTEPVVRPIEGLRPVPEGFTVFDQGESVEEVPFEILEPYLESPELAGTLADPKITDVDREIAQLYNATGGQGLTYDPINARDLVTDDVWTVGRSQGLERKGPPRISPEDVRDFRVRRAADLSQDPERANIGLWNNGSETVFDVSDAYATRDAAIRNGVLGEQIAIGNPNRYYRGSKAAEYQITPDDRIAVRRAQARLDTEAGFQRTVDEWKRGVTPEQAEYFDQSKSDVKRTILDSYLASPTPRAMASMAAIGRNAIDWYRASAEAISRTFGLDAPRFTVLLAALSPQTSVAKNLDATLDLWDRWLRAGRPRDEAAILELAEQVGVLESTKNGVKAALTVDDADLLDPAFLEKSFPVTAPSKSGPSPGTILGGSTSKTNNFAANLLGNVQRLTFDTHMAQGAGGLPRATVGRVLGYRSAVRQGADLIENLTGRAITIPEAQAMIWGPLQAIRARGVSGVDLLTNPDYIAQLSEELANAPNFAKLLTDPYRLAKLEDMRQWGQKSLGHRPLSGSEQTFVTDIAAARYRPGAAATVETRPWERQVFHGTRQSVAPPEVIDWDSWHPWSHFGTAQAAEDRLRGGPKVPEHMLGRQRSRTRSLHIPGGSHGTRYVNVPDMGVDWDPYRVLMTVAPDLEPADVERLREGLEQFSDYPGRSTQRQKWLGDELEKLGYIGLRYKNVVEDPGSTSYVLFNADPYPNAITTPQGQVMQEVARPVDLRDWGMRIDIGKEAKVGNREYLFGLGGGAATLAALNEIQRRRQEQDQPRGPGDFWQRRMQARELAERMAPRAGAVLTPLSGR